MRDSSPKRLFDYRFSGNSYKIRLALSLLRVEVEVVPVDILAGDTHSELFLQRNPLGQIPVLELEDGSFLR
ncbi:MAG: glutathione S-transferase N-terminal domain-containing protein, partial [Planctomycetales bacterium]|nr:glutathione S-transferase N-terminal domain-containing protein [Planctomycetales bacterium]